MKLDQIGFWSEIKVEIMKRKRIDIFLGQKQEIEIA